MSVDLHRADGEVIRYGDEARFGFTDSGHLVVHDGAHKVVSSATTTGTASRNPSLPPGSSPPGARQSCGTGRLELLPGDVRPTRPTQPPSVPTTTTAAHRPAAVDLTHPATVPGAHTNAPRRATVPQATSPVTPAPLGAHAEPRGGRPAGFAVEPKSRSRR